MKKIFNLCLLALFVSFTSCEDATDIIQDGELSEEAAYRNVDDLQTGLNGVYATYAPDAASNGVGNSFLLNAVITDNIKRGIQNNNQGSEVYGFTVNTNTGFPNSIWNSRYGTINFANRVLRNIDRVLENASEADIARADHIKGQLIALRALCHFELMQYFVVDYKAPDSPGVIIMDFVPPLGEVYPRNTVGECFEFILNDINDAQALVNPTATDNFYITQNAIQFLRARVLLFQGNTSDYASIEAIADSILEDHPIITDFEAYSGFWSDANLSTVDEDVFTLFRGVSDNNIAGMFYANETNISGSPFFEMSNELFDLYADDDVRKQVFVDNSSVLSGANRVILINKYPGSSNGLLSNHCKLFRSSEMLLIKAEVQARQGNLTGAAQSVRSLRDARIAGTPALPNYANLNVALADIMVERRKELCYEGHRYLDIKRIGAEINVGINRDSRDCGSFEAPCDLAPTSYLFTMPIPNSELNANNTIQQNPNY
ncbi:RagB/SusD family nutrient uptake outer membrane protein [Flavobacterium salilacus subsp. salilacus]|uniref:RagB/SusD family nutrient uptake outer membrane protein n=1 Tax=Flavobacterium TaxID=237 RepID=UPI0010756A1A|nr:MULTISPECIES: RagB/SusD family nutrient uptake outer membrane protein [Flavobacterium]KAF2519543.1 RagB/SusD family nutrient uptake outer membrane protein [Flavobacterium salilacus subsp. salilacus]MBE1614559.1 RagB/SusD family nutrient uptake outer membrane protein [Flavobacterium sp. SaA2.13]